MNDSELDDLLGQARRAQSQLDLSVQEYAFETRLASHLLERGPSTLVLLWRAVAGCAALAGVVAVWFILSQAPVETEDDLSAFWDSGQASYNAEFLN
jgi:hypothetical protein